MAAWHGESENGISGIVSMASSLRGARRASTRQAQQTYLRIMLRSALACARRKYSGGSGHRIRQVALAAHNAARIIMASTRGMRACALSRISISKTMAAYQWRVMAAARRGAWQHLGKHGGGIAANGNAAPVAAYSSWHMRKQRLGGARAWRNVTRWRRKNSTRQHQHQSEKVSIRRNQAWQIISVSKKKLSAWQRRNKA